MGKRNAVQDAIEEIAEEAKSGFDLRARLQGSAALHEEVAVYTDAQAGKELGGAEDVYQQGINMGRRRWGLLGDIDSLEERVLALAKRAEDNPELHFTAEIDDLEKDLKGLKRNVPAIRKRLDESALVFSLRAVPDLVIRDARRKAKDNLGIKGKGIPDARQEDYDIEYTAIVLAASVVKFVDNADKSVHPTLSVDDARALRDLLPPGQFQKLDNAIVELSFKAQIGNHATDTADF